ncbi:MAG: hypothetical protein QOE35_4026 [Actinomycetota bacterium]|jgi:hypothetical protein
MARRSVIVVAAGVLLAGLVVLQPAGAADVGRPSWWDGDCDANHWNSAAASQGWTGAGAHRLGAVYLGVPVCGPRPGGDHAPDVQWTRSGWGHFEWECTELAFRFMAQIYGVTAYGGNGNAVVRNYNTSYGGNLERVNNGTSGKAPLPGDIISFDRSGAAGHVVVVASSSVNSSGNGSVKVLTQNDTADGWRSLTVTGWTVQGFGSYTPYGWLHDPAGRGGSGAPGGSGPSLSIADVRVTEGAAGTFSKALFTVALSQPVTYRVNVRFQSADGTAHAGSDYDAKSGYVQIRPGTRSEKFWVNVRGDATKEPDENFTVTLSDITGAAVADNQAVATVVNDD